MRSNWFEDFFHGVANDLWRYAMSPEQTEAEATFLETKLGPHGAWLDVPCGTGRHSLALARRGCRMTGFDISRDFIIEAQAAAMSSNLPATFVLGDMRRMEWSAAFDAAFCMGNAFGYFEWPDMEEFTRRFARTLRPGARFVIETGTAAECLLPALSDRKQMQVGDIFFTIENHYLADVSCLQTDATFLRNGRTEQRTWWHWVYTVGEIRRQFDAAGLRTLETLGSLEGEPFKLGSPQLFLVGEKAG